MKKIRTEIKTVMGNVEKLSPDVYRIVNYSSNHVSADYESGRLVQQISGVDNSPIVGHHFSIGWTTVCSIKARVAEYIGIPTKHLELVPEE